LHGPSLYTQPAPPAEAESVTGAALEHIDQLRSCVQSHRHVTLR
jgi:hypothetical protein